MKLTSTFLILLMQWRWRWIALSLKIEYFSFVIWNSKLMLCDGFKSVGFKGS
ncbi:unnamed protein product [Linum tenue]|uniref:Uncharacterized protein n=1 Tax=Linum tenue TaxID=586396 RepID=A0AAV0JB53_9ROSI|nr:unnamed protein product [Linum tenue]